MTNLQKEKTQTAILDYCTRKEVSRNELSTRIGVSNATISKMANGKWDDIDDKLWKKVWNYVSQDHADGIYNTKDYASVINLCNSARKHHLMIGLIGDTGMGKTTALRAYSLRKNVYYYYIDATVSPKVFLREMLQEMGVAFEGSINDMLQRVAAELNTQNNPLVILDESAKISDKMMLLLHSLRDKTMKNCGFVLAGMPDFKNRLIKYVNKGKTGYGEFYRRINIWHELKGLTTEEINYILTETGITDSDIQREFRKLRRFGDLTNEINLYLTINE